MNEPTPLGTLVRSLTRGQILGLRSDLVADGSGRGLSVPQFEDRLWHRRLEGNELTPLPSDLLGVLAEEHGPAVFIDTFPQTDDSSRRRRLTIRTARGLYRDSGAFVHQALVQLPPSTPAVFLAPASLTTTQSYRVLRRELQADHREWWGGHVHGGAQACHRHCARVGHGVGESDLV